MLIKSAEFVVSNSRVEKCPTTGLPEYAFIGRSNVGKSSLINMLTGRKGLAMTSQKPGKTQLINHFIINKEWHLVDLPGYGYARLSKDGRDGLRRMIEDYVLERRELVCLFVLLDARLEPQKIDLEFIEWLGEESVPFALVFTKADKLSKGKLSANISAYKDRLLEGWEELPPLFITSSEERTGREELLNYIEGINNTL
ncbi:ribosome biogenesis GTP-binding protein YihA/YsxC [Porphyromonas catoniae]|jgi:ribosome biogenesis GTP-binding protein ysxC|uniref:Probable GTP-binding protein EngB n=1 Tax=Porphyromonas catoniae ATCC 51270 TaxID=887901 RepID=Z4WU12_9PORP|nr:ribosome biogenesis GTP-binding protein YihA/YsxC [Porphyromonas catoniae]EWC92778.1 ribosome biogenesis GTP-binding protein YsxC [Porphyromonas catoniae ATCC 51270]